MSRASRMWIVMALVLSVALVLAGCERPGRGDALAVPTEEGGIAVLPSLTPSGEGTGGEAIATPPAEVATPEDGVESGGGLAEVEPSATPLGEGYPPPALPSTPAPGVSPGTGLVTPQAEETVVAVASPEVGIELTPPAPEVGASGVEPPTTGGESPAPSQGTYSVQAGDTLFSIATRYNTTVDQLRALNGLTTNFIYVGQQLKVPGDAGTTGSQGTAGTPGTVIHTVQRGEWLYAIARKYNTTPEAIMRANGLTNPNLIYVGQRLTIPGQGAAPSSPPATGSTGGRVHTVAAGDTLFSIAIRYGTTVEALRARNALGSNTIYVGQQIAIP